MVRILCFLIVGTLVLSAALTPLVVLLIEQIWGENPWPFSRVLNRVAMLSVVIMLVVLRKQMDFAVVRSALSGLNVRAVAFPIFFGFILTAVSVAATVLIMVYGTNDLVWTSDPQHDFAYRALKFAVTALFIAFIEELFFRVMLLQGLKARTGFFIAAIVTSAIYACVHFIVPVKTWQYDGVKLAEGFWYLSAVFSEFLRIEIILPLIGLFIVGMVLSLVIERSKSLFYCVGLHAGWILGAKLTRFLTDAAGDSPLANLVGHFEQHHLVALVPAWLSVIVVGIVALWSLPLFERATGPKRMV